MAQEDESQQSRRDVLKKVGATGAAGAVGGGGAIESLFGTVKAEQATASDLEQIKRAPGVQRILSALEVGSLPHADSVEKRRFSDDGEATSGELTIMKVQLALGELVAMRRSDTVSAFFSFDPEAKSVPEKYSMAASVSATLGASDEGLRFTRRATDIEQRYIADAIKQKLGENAELGRIQANPDVGGFVGTTITDEVVDGEETRKVKNYQFSVEGSFNPATESWQDSYDVRKSESASVTMEPVVEPHFGFGSLVYEVITGWLESNFADEPLEILGVECDDTCTTCALWIVDVFTTCSVCVSFCSTAVSGVGAIICLACFFAFCTPPIDMVNCSACMACLLTGDEPYVPPSPSDQLFDWVWDEIPTPPSLPDIPN